MFTKQEIIDHINNIAYQTPQLLPNDTRITQEDCEFYNTEFTKLAAEYAKLIKPINPYHSNLHCGLISNIIVRCKLPRDL